MFWHVYSKGKFMKWLLLFAGLCANAGASILIKEGVRHGFILELSSNGLLNFLKNWSLVLGIILYGIAFILYTLSLSKLPLNVVHPSMTAGSIVIVGICAYLIFHEKFSGLTITGYSLILTGVLLVSLGK